MSYIKEADHSEKSVINAAYDNASNDLVQENNVTVQRKAAVFNLITNVTTQPIQKKGRRGIRKEKRPASWSWRPYNGFRWTCG